MWPFKSTAKKLEGLVICDENFNKYFDHYELECWQETKAGLLLTIKRVYKDRSFETFEVVKHDNIWRKVTKSFSKCADKLVAFIEKNALPKVEFEKKVMEVNRVPYSPKV